MDLSSSAGSSLLSRLRAGSMPQRSQFAPLPSTASPFGPSIFSSWNPAATTGNIGRERGSTLASIASVGSNGPSSPAQSQFSREGGGESDVHMRTLDYLGLAETPQQARAQIATPYIPPGYLQQSRFRSYSVNNTDRYNNDDDVSNNGTALDDHYAVLQDELAATQAAIHQHNQDVQRYVSQASGRPRAYTAGILGSNSSRLMDSYANGAGGISTPSISNDLGHQDDRYDDLPQALGNMGLGRSNSRNAGTIALEPTVSLWLGGIPKSTTTSTLIELYKQYGPILSARVITSKDYGFVNFERLDSSIAAKAATEGKELFPGAGAIRVNFANPKSGLNTPGHDSLHPSPSPDPTAQAQNGAMLLGDGTSQASGTATPSVPALRDMVNDIMEIVMQFGASDEDKKAISRSLSSAVHFDTFVDEIPPIREPSLTRVHDAPKLREIRKRIESGTVSETEMEAIVIQMLPEIAELASDYLGNTVVQKLFEKRPDQEEQYDHVRNLMLQEIGPHIAEIGTHKNGTWAAQKIIEVCETPEQKNIIVENLRPYCIPLFLDQFGNYVLQGTLKFGAPFNDYLFETMLSRMWDIAQGRFGARAMRASLESHHATRNQLRMLAATIALHSVQLATNANGALLLTWFLDTCTFPQRRTVLAPRLIPHLVHLCTHRVAYLTVLKVINQRAEPEARDQILQAIFFTPNDQILEQILSDANCGATLIFKLLTTPYFDESIRSQVVENIKKVLTRIKAQPSQGYKRLMDEVGMSTRAPSSTREPSNQPEQRQRPASRHNMNGQQNQNQQFYNQSNPPGFGMGQGLQSGGEGGESFPVFNQGIMYNAPGAMNVNMQQMQFQQQGMMGRGNPQMGYNFPPMQQGFVGYGGPNGPIDQYRQQGVGSNNQMQSNAQGAFGQGFAQPGYGMGGGGGGGNFMYGGNAGYAPQDQGNQRRGRVSDLQTIP